MEVLKMGVDEEISHKIRVESRELVRTCRPSGGGKRPAVQGRVWDERTATVFPKGTGRYKRSRIGCSESRTLP